MAREARAQKCDRVPVNVISPAAITEISCETVRTDPVWRLRAVKTVMARTGLENVLTYLWELSDGTRAYVVEHAFAPRWEVCLVRRDRVVQRQRCETIEQLMAASMSFHAAASAR